MISVLKRILTRGTTLVDAVPTVAPADPLVHPEEYSRGVSFVRDQVVAAVQSATDATRPSWWPFSPDLTGDTYEVVELVRLRALGDVEKMRGLDAHPAQVAGAEAALVLIEKTLSDGVEHASRGRFDLVSNATSLIAELNDLAPFVPNGSRS